MCRKYTPENITHLKPDDIFVFGSDPEGVHNIKKRRRTSAGQGGVGTVVNLSGQSGPSRGVHGTWGYVASGLA